MDIDGGKLKPQVSWGTSPEMVIDIDSTIPEPKSNSESDALRLYGSQKGHETSRHKIGSSFS